MARPRRERPHLFQLPTVSLDDLVHLLHITILEQCRQRLQCRVRAKVERILCEELHLVAPWPLAPFQSRPWLGE